MEQDSGAPMNLDDLLEGLRDVTERLDAASDNFDERVSLREQQRELQATAAQLRQKARTSSQITRELDRLKRLRRRIDSSHLSVGHIGGGNGQGGGGIEPRYVFAVNDAIDEAWDRADLEARIERVEAELTQANP